MMESGDSSVSKQEIPLLRERHESYISTMNYCQTAEASHLCIFDACIKLETNTGYNIGGTYSSNDPELWFYFTSSYYHGNNHLLNLFCCHRKRGLFSITVPDSTELIQKAMPGEDVPFLVLSNTLKKVYTFQSEKPDQHHYIKTYCFSKISKFDPMSVLIIPVKIDFNPVSLLSEEIVKSIKLQHDLSRLMNMQEKTDFVLESATHKQFPTHRILIAAHSPVLRNMIKNDNNTLFIDISDNDMELLLEFIYTGTIKNITKQDCLKLLEIADKFQLKPLFLLTQYVIGDQIKITNAVEMAVIAKKFNLRELQTKVFKFIIKNPDVMKTDAWLNLGDVELTKDLFQYMHAMKE